ncbi:hypothetical protein GH741_08465 [Aquibacillus halophilus]|uniref:Calcineurin-like phosphoesterase domain-containing protein n=1 Tax=Aquibacillus halophilus TaxID=930132 RepID=A0A6A8DFT6_9BACI|nr:metallophosphoesterase [Aquibacillus halophilus]MRH42719.1 hypothetical protein [Aquibacillus halophilus]
MKGTILLMFFLVVYTVWDNNRIIVVKQDIPIEDLPNELENYTILQVSDLHEKNFGKNQERLIKAINSIKYDAILFTGDMIENKESATYQPFYEVLEGIENKKTALFIPGNTDPDSYYVHLTVEKSEFINGLEDRGVKLLESVYTVEVGTKTIDFVNFELSIMDGKVSTIEGIPQPSYIQDNQYIAYQSLLLEEMKYLDQGVDKNVLIALSHYPAIDARIDQINERPLLKMRNFDLVIAGHYHGGQIRLPFIGALFVPEPWYSDSFFPPQNRVKGLWEYKGLKQYVSAGLGSSDAVSYLDFRFLNSPEINVLKFKKSH